jgi:hypothetical protein
MDASSGILSGTPTAAGSFSFTVYVQNSTAFPIPGSFATRSYTIIIYNPISISPGVFSLPAAVIGVPYTTTLSATGGSGSYTWTGSTGFGESGLTINSSTGTISGTPIQGILGYLVVTATDTVSYDQNDGSQGYILTVYNPVLASSIVMPVNYQTIHGSAFPVSGWCVDTSGVSSVQVNVDGGAWQTATLTLSPTDLPAQDAGYQAVAVDFSYILDARGLSDGHHVLYVQEVSDYNSTINTLQPYPVYVNVDNHGYIS